MSATTMRAWIPLVDRRRARGVRVRSASVDAAPEPGRDILAPAVVSAVDVKQTYLRLLPRDSVPPRVLRRVRGYELALPLAVVYLVLDRDLAAQGYANTARIVSDADVIDATYAAVSAGELPAAGCAFGRASIREWCSRSSFAVGSGR